MTYRLALILLAPVALLAGCGTLSEPLSAFAPPASADVPQDALAATAAQIERHVALQDAEAPLETAANVSLSNPLILQAIRTRTLRHPRIAELLLTGHIYELPNGLIRIKTSGDYQRATTRQERDRNAQSVAGENADRWTLYEGIVEENKWPGRALDQIRSTFFTARLDAMAPGEHYQDPSGAIVAKQR